MNLQGLRIWVPITYEKMPRICFCCGRITHGTYKEACAVAKGQETGDQFGSWLRTSQSQSVECRAYLSGSTINEEAVVGPSIESLSSNLS